MAVNILNADSTSQWVANTASDTYVVEEGVYLAVNGTAINGTAAVTNRKFQIDGHVIGESGASGMFIGQDATNGGSTTIQIGATGSVLGEAYGIVSHGGDLNLLNKGSIEGAVGLYMSGEQNVVQNLGTIVSWSSVGISSQGDYAEIQNSGTISGVEGGILLAGTHSVVINNGTILGKTTGGGGAIESEGSDIVINSGLISGWLRMGDDADVVRNLGGTIHGHVDLGTGDDVFESKNGTFESYWAINGGEGNDIFHIDDAGIRLSEFKNEGYDTVYASASYTLEDNFEQLTLQGAGDLTGRGNSLGNYITGNAGDNRLYGRGGSDAFFAGQGNDLYDGGTGIDVIGYWNTNLGGVTINLASGMGGGGAIGQRFEGIENVLGSGFNDRIIGNAAANRIDGGSGNDMLTGGGGKDTFVFLDGNAKDTVTDFKDGIDTIDFTFIYNSLTIDTFMELKPFMKQKGDDVVMDFSSELAGNVLTIRNLDVSDLSAADFIFN